MGLCASVSISISRQERGDVEVTEQGVRRILKSGEEEFFPRPEIAGFVVSSTGVFTLIGHSSSRQMIIPRSIESYGNCIAELRATGIESLPLSRLNRKRSITDWIFGCLATFLASLYFSHGLSQTEHRIEGLAFVLLVQLQIVREERKTGKHQWINWTIQAVLVGVVAWLW